MKQVQHVLMTGYDRDHRELLMMCYRDAVDNRQRPAGNHRAEELLLSRGLVEIDGGFLQISPQGVILWESYLKERDALNKWYQSNHRHREKRVRQA